MKENENQDESTKENPTPQDQTRGDNDADKLYPETKGDDEVTESGHKSEDSQEKKPSSDAPGNEGDTPKDDQTSDSQGKETQKTEAYDLETPSGTFLTDKDISDFRSFAKEEKLGKDEAQKILNFMSEKHSSELPGGKSYQDRIKRFDQLALDDPNLGGSQEKYDENIKLGTDALKTFFPEVYDEMKEFLRLTGYSHHPGIIKGFANIGRNLQNDGFVKGSSKSGKDKDVPIWDKLYPTTINA
jgi:hypothetical protein